MPYNPDAEDALEVAVIELMTTKLGWTEWANCFDEQVGPENSLGRGTQDEVILKPRLLAAIQKFNPDLPEEAHQVALTELARDRSAMSLAAANAELYGYLKDGVRVVYQDENDGRQQVLVKLIDWHQPRQNEFFLAQQLWVVGPHHKRRPDLVGFVNGLPLLLIELKKASVNVKHAYDDNLIDYKDTVPQLFWHNGVIILSNGGDSRLGSLTAGWDHFAQWKKIDDEEEEGVIALETMLRAAATPERLLDLVENFTLFSQGRGETAKIVAKNHQYLGVNNAIQAVRDIKANQGRLGVFWHTQGSGKSFSMLFFAQKILRKVPGNWTFVIITDRLDLDGQIYKNFAAAGAVTEPERTVRAQNGRHLQQLLQEDHRYIFTLIQKFGVGLGETYPLLSERDDIIVMTDEAHRSQYDTLARNMRTALPNAAFIGFTGTPLMAGEELTKEVFGDYVSIYNFSQSIADGATVPLYYENRIPEVQLTNENLNDDLEKLLEEAELSEAAEQKLERAFAREYHIITDNQRLNRVAADIVQHFLSRGHQGKAMVVSVDKVTAGRMYAKVQAEWQKQLAQDKQNATALPPGDYRDEVKTRITSMEETDMALVVSQGQNEIKQFADKGLDILPHRERLNKEPLDEYFKNPDHPLRIVFVCAMWMTGFDVPNCSTIYLDKPMRNHTLMQTIARANRVYEGKNNGLIVDYVGIFRNLEKALAIYGSASGGGIQPGEKPIKSKEDLVGELEEALAEANDFCTGLGINLAELEQSEGFKRISLQGKAINAILVNDETKRAFLALAGVVERLFKAILPDTRANEFNGRRGLLKTLVKTIRSLDPDVDISDLVGEVEALVGRSLYVSPVAPVDGEPFDLSQIDFDALRHQFEQRQKNTEAAKLRGRLNVKAKEMTRLNQSRIDFLKKLQALIDDYNAGRIDVDLFFEKLMAFAKELQEEDQRAMVERLTEEELALFDILLKPAPELTKEEVAAVKKVAQELLATLKKQKLVLDWRKRQRTRAAVQMTIEDWLEQLPASYDDDLWDKKVDMVYSHVYDNYYGAGNSLYAYVS